MHKNPLRIIGLFLLSLIFSFGSPSAVNKMEKASNKKKTHAFKIPVWVQRAPSEAEKKLRKEDFKILIEKTPLEISSVRGPESPMLLFVAFDTVGEISNINHARVAIIEEIKSLGAQYWVGLLGAQEQLTVLQEPTPEKTSVQQKIEGLNQIGKAGLLDSIQAVADLTTGILLKSDVRVAVIFITDSDIGNYRENYLNPPVNASDSRDLSRRFAGRALQEKISHMTTLLARYQAPIFIVHVDPGRDPLNRAYHNGLKQLAESVGGQLFLSKAASDIQAAIHEAFQWACRYYLLGFSLSGSRSGFVRIQVSLSNEQTFQSGMRLHYPNRIYFP